MRSQRLTCYSVFEIFKNALNMIYHINMKYYINLNLEPCNVMWSLRLDTLFCISAYKNWSNIKALSHIGCKLLCNL